MRRGGSCRCRSRCASSSRENYSASGIRVDVDVELPDELTSGAQVRFFGATGEAPRRGAANPLKVRTIISARCTVLLYDAFSKRRISPSQSFCFDEIVPDEQRVADVEAELVDQGSRFRSSN